MIDPKLLRTESEKVAAILKQKRGFELNVKRLKELENKRKTIQAQTQELQNERNIRSKEIGFAKAQGNDVTPAIEAMSTLIKELEAKTSELNALQAELQSIYDNIPNIPNEIVPEGNSEEENVEVKRWGKPTEFAFKPKDHVELGEQLGMMDFDLAAKITGSRFVVLKDKLVRLHRALAQFMLDLHTDIHGYKEIYVPYIVNHDTLYGTGNLPKFYDDIFHIAGDFKYSLIPTAEVPVTNVVRNEIIDADKLPLKFVCHTPCFRSEAGTYGKDMRGMIRQHQFEKVELVHITHPGKSYEAHEELTSHAEAVLEKLNLPYRRVILCGGDLGFGSAKTYDLEVWLPGQNKYREISSCSNLEAFQARRMQARFRNSETGKPELLHTLNGSGVAIGRALIAIMENYQDEKGNIHIPEVLWGYMGGVKVIKVLI